MGCRNLDFLDMLVRISGIHYDRYTGVGNLLVSLTDLLTLQEGETLVWIRGCNPKRCWLPDYSEVDFGDEDTTETDFPPQNEASPVKVGSFLEILKTVMQEEPTKYEMDVTELFKDAPVWDNAEDFDTEEVPF